MQPAPRRSCTLSQRGPPVAARDHPPGHSRRPARPGQPAPAGAHRLRLLSGSSRAAASSSPARPRGWRGRLHNGQPLPVNLDTVRETIHSGQPAPAAPAALAAFHALRSGQLAERARIPADLAPIPPSCRGALFGTEQGDRRGYDAHTCRIADAASSHIYALPWMQSGERSDRRLGLFAQRGTRRRVCACCLRRVRPGQGVQNRALCADGGCRTPRLI